MHYLFPTTAEHRWVDCFSASVAWFKIKRVKAWLGGSRCPHNAPCHARHLAKFASNSMNVKNAKGTFFSACLHCRYSETTDIVQSRSTGGTTRGFIPGWLVAVSDGSDSRTSAPAISAAGFALMFEGISVATAHAGTTSGSSPPYRDNWVTLEFAEGLEGEQGFSSAPKWVAF